MPEIYTDPTFSFGTKAETLQRLDGRLALSSIPAYFYFTVSDWEKDADAIIAKTARHYGKKTIIVRSSSRSEDTHESAMAGAFLSVGGIHANDQAAFRDAVQSVISSYQDDNPTNHILVQEMVQGVSMSGVLFTRDMNTGAPYYVINYDDETGRTDTISSGTGYCNRTLLVHRQSVEQLTSPRFQALLRATVEIERVVDNREVDIEFALDVANNVHLFQVRPITTQRHWNDEIDTRVGSALMHLQKDAPRLLGRRAHALGSRAILGRMPDWNPAEMIGSCPRPLAYSLYRSLITDHAWRVARKRMGYASPTGNPLMHSLCGQPFIDVRLSFHSYLPASLPAEIGTRLVDAWLDRLEANPHLHDKVEFDVALTTLSFDHEQRIAKQFPTALDRPDLDTFIEHLRVLTRDLITGERGGIADQLGQLEVLVEERRRLYADSPPPSLETVKALLEDCVEHGTIPFSILARHGFVANSFLKSLLARNVFTPEDVERFYNSLDTIARRLLKDLNRCSCKALSLDAFMETYGHLRPGTYDILSMRYDQRQDMVASHCHRSADAAAEPFALSPAQADQIRGLLDEYGYPLSPEEFLSYLGEAIRNREYGKFLFTKNISDALEILAAWGDAHGLDRETLSFVSIADIMDCMTDNSGKDISQLMGEKAARNRNAHQVSQAVQLPHLISRPADMVIVPFMVDQPTFITRDIIQGDVLLIDGTTKASPLLDHKIIAIESSDPGFDWVFSRPIKGLITKFGGANSHMAIRCAEFGLPAMIGCGQQIFDRSIKAQTVLLNCAEARIVPLVE